MAGTSSSLFWLRLYSYVWWYSVSSNAIVTASHCIPPYANSGIITLGAHEYFNARALNVTILSIHQHPGWDKSKRTNDIAVIKLAEHVEFTNKIQPACLPNKDHCFPEGTACVASGWGYIKEGGPRSSLLREVAVRLMKSEHCNRADYYNGRILGGMLCAGYNAGERDACTGDSGGPLVCPLQNGKWVLVGATSWGVGCARHKRPGVYSDVRQFSDWIASIIHEYPDVVGTCATKGISGFGVGGNYGWGMTVPKRPPGHMIYDSSGSPMAAVSSAIVTPDLASINDLWNSLASPTSAPEKKPTKEVVKPTMAPKPKPAASSNPCAGLTGKVLKKCKKKQKKKAMGGGSKKAKKDRKKKKKELKALFDGMTKAEKKAAKKANEEETAMREAGYEVDSSMEEDDNILFGGWDMQ